MVTEWELAAATKAVREQAPPGMGDFTIRSLARAALEAADEARTKRSNALRKAQADGQKFDAG